MRSNSTWLVGNVGALLLGVSAFTAPTLAQTPSSEWQFSAVVYGYFAELNGSATFPTGTTVNISVDPHQMIRSLNFAFMGAFEANHGPWGVFTDIMYLDASGSKAATRALSIGGVMIPANVTANAHLDITSTVWTLGGSYRVVGVPEATVDLVAGARGLFLKQNLSWQFSADVGPLVGPGRQGSGDSNPTNWDGIIGVKGRWMFGDKHAWFVPYYVDIGTGGSQFTWQGITGLGYAFSWGEVTGVWRYLDYRFSSHSASLTLSGPAIGVAFRW
jgi:hypothetical protein